MTESLPDLILDIAAADRVMTCRSAGLRAYAQAGGLDPARDFRGLDLSGWPLAGQDLAGFDFTDCDLRGTGIESARLGPDTRLDGAVLDEGAIPGAAPEPPGVNRADLDALAKFARELHDKEQSPELARFGRGLLPLLTSLFDAALPSMRQIRGFVGFGELREGEPAAGRELLQQTLELERGAGVAETDGDVLRWRFYSAEALLDLGRAAEALAELDALLPLDETAGGARDPDTLNTRQYRARALLDLGRAAEALAELDALRPLDEAVRGARDPDTLNTRQYRARALLELGRAAEALAEFDALLPLDEAMRGAHDPGTLITRHGRARALLDLGRAAEALAELDALLPLDEAVRGARDTGTLTTRHDRARALLDLHREQEAASEMRAVGAAFAARVGEAHRWRAVVRVDEIGARMALGETGFSAELAGLVERLARGSYPHAGPVLRARYRLARSLLQDGDEAAARRQIAAVLAEADKPGRAQYRYVRAMQRLLAELDRAEPLPP